MLKNIATQALETLRRLTARAFADVPLRAWPKIVGRIHEVHVPSRVRPYPGPTATSPSNINILLELLDLVASVEGDVAECGVFQGSALVAMALHLRQSGTHRTIYGFDSFEGFGATIEMDRHFERSLIDPKMTASGFSDTSVERVTAKLDLFALTNVHLIKGFFETTLVTCPETHFSFIHLDCDTYAAYRECLNYFYPRLRQGAIVVFDEYNDDAWPGCKKAVDEFLQDGPELLVEICRDNYVKTYMVKC